MTDALDTPEGPQRRKAQGKALEMLARIERNVSPTAPGRRAAARGSAGSSAVQSRRGRACRPRVNSQPSTSTSSRRSSASCSTRCGASPTVMEAAATLHMSRSNVYSSLRRISRKLGTKSVRELLHLVRHGDLFTEE